MFLSKVCQRFSSLKIWLCGVCFYVYIYIKKKLIVWLKILRLWSAKAWTWIASCLTKRCWWRSWCIRFRSRYNTGGHTQISVLCSWIYFLQVYSHVLTNHVSGSRHVSQRSTATCGSGMVCRSKDRLWPMCSRTSAIPWLTQTSISSRFVLHQILFLFSCRSNSILLLF